MNLSEKYTCYCKPELGKLLKVIRLDKVYHRAEGDKLYYFGKDGEEIIVTDFLGGYGASLFGHNNAELIDTAMDNLRNKLPFNAQASCRSQAALLCEKLNQMMQKRTNANYVITLASTGTEAVEAAIKHAELYHTNRLKQICEEVSKQIIHINKVAANKNLVFSNDSNEVLSNKVGAFPDNDLQKILSAVNAYNYRSFKASPVFISVERGFHGKTTGSVKLTFNNIYRKPFGRIGLDVCFVKEGDIQAIEKIITESSVTYYKVKINSNNQLYLEANQVPNISAMFIEPLQGEGGIHILDRSFLDSCRKITQQYKIPLVFDEIQCGMGRTGTFLFSEQQGVVADYYLLSKSLGGGLSKISALLVNTDLYENEFGMIHSSTFAEDDHSAALALKSLEILERDDEIYQKCTQRGKQLMDGIKRIQERYPSVIKAVRGIGLMIGIEFWNQTQNQAHADSLIFKTLSEQNMLGYIFSGYLLHEHRIRVAPTLSSNTTIRLEPSAYIAEADCELLLASMERLCEVYYKRNVYELTKFIIGKESYGAYPLVEDFRTKTAAYPSAHPTVEQIPEKNIKRVAFLGHFIESRHMVLWDKSFALFSEEELDQLTEAIYETIDPVVDGEQIVASKSGDYVRLVFIGLLLTSKIISRHMKNKDMKLITDKVNAAVDVAIANNCKAIGFGAYTSIVTNNCKNIVTDSAALTTGNSLTVGMGLEALLRTSKEVGVKLEESCFAAVGAKGNIASIYSEIIAEDVPKLILIGNKGREKNIRKVAERIYANAFREILNYRSGLATGNGAELRGIAKAIESTKSIQGLLSQNANLADSGSRIYDLLEAELGSEVPILITSDYQHLKKANIILSASNAPDAVIFPEMLNDEPVVICDIAVPEDTHKSVREQCKNVTVIKGGLVKLPLNPEFSIPGMPVKKGETFACLSETLLMGLSGISNDYSIGIINKNQVKKIVEIARIHGFELGDIKTETSL